MVEAAAVEPVAEAAVEVAEIEGATAVALAEIEAATSLEHHELGVEETRIMAEAMTDEEVQTWRTRAETLAAENTVLREQLAKASPSLPEPDPSLSPSGEARTDGGSESGEGGEPPTPPEPQSEAAVAAAEPPPEPERKRPHHRWI